MEKKRDYMKDAIKKLEEEQSLGRRQATLAEIEIMKLKNKPVLHHKIIAFGCLIKHIGYTLKEHAYNTYSKRCVIKESVLRDYLISDLCKSYPDATIAFNFFGQFDIKLSENKVFMELLEMAKQTFPSLDFRFSQVVEEEFFDPVTGCITSPDNNNAVAGSVEIPCLEIILDQ